MLRALALGGLGLRSYTRRTRCASFLLVIADGEGGLRWVPVMLVEMDPILGGGDTRWQIGRFLVF